MGYKGYGGGNITITSSHVLDNGQQGVKFILTKDDDLRNVTVVGNSLAGVRLGTRDALNDSNVSDNGGSGVDIYGGTDTQLRNVTLNRNGDHGVTIESSSTNDRILDADIQSNTKNGLFISETSSGTVVRNTNLSHNGFDGVNISASADTFLKNVTGLGNGGVAFHSESGATNTTAKQFTLPGANVSFDALDVELAETASRPADKGGYVNVGTYVNATNTSSNSWLDVNVTYDDSNLGAVSESSLALWKYDDAGGWTNVTDGRDTAQNYVYGNFSTFSTLAPLGPVDVPGTAVSGCRNVTSPGRYTLVRNVSNATADVCIDVQSSDVIVDGYGFTVDGVNQTSSSIGIRGTAAEGSLRNVTVRNVTVKNWSTGVGYSRVDASEISNATVTHNSLAGVSLFRASNNLVTDDALISNGGSANGLEIARSSDGNEIRGSNISLSGGLGIRTSSSADSVIADNVLHSNENQSILIDSASPNTTISNNTVSGTGTTTNAINVNRDKDGRLLNNTVTNASQNGIRLSGATNYTISGNHVSKSGQNGIALISSSLAPGPTNNTTVTDNVLEDNGRYGLYLSGSSHNLVRNNTAYSTTNTGIVGSSGRGHSSIDNLFVNNTAKNNNAHGFEFDDGARNVTLRNNTARSNTEDGYHLTGSQEVTLRWNDATANTRDGLNVTNVSAPQIEGNDLSQNRNGLAFNASDVTGPVVVDNAIKNNNRDGIYATETGNDTLIRNNNVSLNTALGTGIHLDVGQNTTNVTVESNTLVRNNGGGLHVSVAADTLVSDLTVTDNDVLHTTGDGIWLDAGTGANVSAVVQSNTITDSIGQGVYLTGAGEMIDISIEKNDLEQNNNGVQIGSDVPVWNITIHHNNFDNANYGVENLNQTNDTWVDATDNWWGAADGPSTDSGLSVAALKDPVNTGVLADGSGDKVSVMNNTAARPYNETSNVHFAPFLTERYPPAPPSSPSGGSTGGGGGGSGGGGAAVTSNGNLVRVVSASLSDDRIAPGDSVTVSAVVRNDRSSPARFTTTLFVDSAPVANRTDSIPADSNRTVTYRRQFGDAGRYRVDVNGVDAGTLVVGTPPASPTPTPTVTPPGTATETAGSTATATPTAGPPATPGGSGGIGFPALVLGLLVLLVLLGGGFYYYQQQ